MLSQWRQLVRRILRNGQKGHRVTRRKVSQGTSGLAEQLERRIVLSAFSFGSSGSDRIDEVATDSAGNVYVVGGFRGTIDVDPGPGTVNLKPAGSAAADGFLIKYDSAGALVWAKNGKQNRDWLPGEAEIAWNDGLARVPVPVLLEPPSRS